MKTVTRVLALCCVLGIPAVAPVFAAGPIDGEVSAVWWANDFDSQTETTSTSGDAGAPGLRAELWLLERYGVRASQFGSEPDGSSGADYTSVDFMWRALSPTENNFVAVGLGWQQMSVAELNEDPSGMRLSVAGRMGLMGMLYVYGHGAYLPSLGDARPSAPLASTFKDLDAYEYELGVAWNAMPFMNVHAGYHLNNLSYTQQTFTTSGISGGVTAIGTIGAGAMTSLSPGAGPSCSDCSVAMTMPGGSGETESSGFFLGLGFQF